MTEILIGKFRIERKLSSGGFGRVFQATKIDQNDLVAVKLITCSSELEENVKKEARFLQKLQKSKFFPKFYELIKIEDKANAEKNKADTYLIACELLGPNLKEALTHADTQTKKFWFKEKQINDFFRFFISGRISGHVIGYPENSYFCKANQPILCKSNYGKLGQKPIYRPARNISQPTITVP